MPETEGNPGVLPAIVAITVVAAMVGSLWWQAREDGAGAGAAGTAVSVEASTPAARAGR